MRQYPNPRTENLTVLSGATVTGVYGLALEDSLSIVVAPTVDVTCEIKGTNDKLFYSVLPGGSSVTISGGEHQLYMLSDVSTLKQINVELTSTVSGSVYLHYEGVRKN